MVQNLTSSVKTFIPHLFDHPPPPPRPHTVAFFLPLFIFFFFKVNITLLLPWVKSMYVKKINNTLSIYRNKIISHIFLTRLRMKAGAFLNLTT